MPRILIVDDEKMIRNVVKEYAEFEGYETAEAENGMEAVELCRKEDFDIIVMDIMMPRLDGYSAVKEIHKTKPIPVIMLSARGEEYDKLFGFEIRFDGLEINVTGREVTIDGVPAQLTPKEYDLLFFLVRNKGIALSREKLLEVVWGYDFYGDDRTVDTHIKMLRSSLGEYRRFIITLRGMGYKFDAQADRG